MVVIDMMIVWLVFLWLLWIITNYYGDHWVQYIVGAMFVVLSIFMLTYGIDDANNWLTRSIAFIHLGIGLLTIIIPVVENMWGGKKDEDF